MDEPTYPTDEERLSDQQLIEQSSQGVKDAAQIIEESKKRIRESQALLADDRLLIYF